MLLCRHKSVMSAGGFVSIRLLGKQQKQQNGAYALLRACVAQRFSA